VQALHRAQPLPFHTQRIGRSAINHCVKEFVMNKNQVQGRATEVKGDIKEAAGKVAGNQKLQGEGLVDQAKGKAQAVYGDAKEEVKKGIDRH